MLIIKQQRDLLRKKTLTQKFIHLSPDIQRRASCYCDQCGKLTHLQSIFFNTPLTVQQHLKSVQSTAIQQRQIRKQISNSFHLNNPLDILSDKRCKRRKSCNCDLCGNQTHFQQKTNFKIPQRKTIPQDSFKNFIIKKQLGRVFKIISDQKGFEKSTMTSRSSREALLKSSGRSPLLIKHELSRKGKVIQKLYESKGYQQKIDLRRQKTEKSPPIEQHLEHYHKLSKFSRTSDRLIPLARFK